MFDGFLFQDSSGHGDSQKETAQPADGSAWAKGLRRADGVTDAITPRQSCIGARTAQDPGPSRPFDDSTRRTEAAADQASSMLKGTGLRMVLATGE